MTIVFLQNFCSKMAAQENFFRRGKMNDYSKNVGKSLFLMKQK